MTQKTNFTQEQIIDDLNNMGNSTVYGIKSDCYLNDKPYIVPTQYEQIRQEEYQKAFPNGAAWQPNQQ